MLYAHARLDRTGLGNMLFPWARSEVFREERQCLALSPPWTRWLRVGPWLRGEKDKRLYRGCFTSAGYVSGIRKAMVLATHRQVSEPVADSPTSMVVDSGVVQFRGMRGLFDPFAAHSPFLRRRLQAIVQPWVRQTVASQWPMERRFIAVHIRRGDFQPWDPVKVTKRFMSVQLPVAWYAAAINHARALVNDDLEVLIFTDGDGRDLQPLLRQPMIRLANDAPAVCHLLGMSNASAIVGSASSFSMWAAFLSTAPAIWFPGVPQPPRSHQYLNNIVV